MLFQHSQNSSSRMKEMLVYSRIMLLFYELHAVQAGSTEL